MTAKKNRKRGGRKRTMTATPDGPPGGGAGRSGGAGGPGRGGGASASAGTAEFPGWLPWVLYGVLTVFLFRGFIFSDGMLFGSDTLGLGYQARRFYADALRELGTFPLWNPTILGGTPFIESLAGGDSLYPTALLLLLMETHRALGWKLILHVYVAGMGGYAWLRRGMGLSQGASLVGGTAFLLAPWMVSLTYPGGDGKLFVTALAPLMFLATRTVMTRPGLLSAAGTAAIVATVILSTHFQAAYFLFGAAGAYAIFLAVSRWRAGGDEARRPALRAFGVFLGAALWGAAISSVQLLPAVDYVTEFSRRTATTTEASAEVGVAYSSQFSLHPEEIAGLVVPEFVGVTVRPQSSEPIPEWVQETYWGRNGFKLNHEYFGIVVCLLALLSFLAPARRGERIFFASLSGVVLLFTLGTHTPVWRIFYELVPGIPLFRAPSIAIFVAGFGVVTLAAMGVEHLRDLASGASGSGADSTGVRRGLVVLGVAAGALLLLTALSSGGTLLDLWTGVFWRDDPSAAARAAVAGQFIPRGLFLAFLFAAAVSGLLWAASRSPFGGRALVVALVLLVAIDHYRVDAPFVQTIPATSVSEPDPIAQVLLDQMRTSPPFRVLDLGGRSGIGQEVRYSAFGIELAGGHHPNDLQSYRELIGMIGGGEPTNLLDSDAVRRILNVRYLTWPDARLGPPNEAFTVVSATTLGGQPYESLIELPTLPRARLVGRAVVLPEDEAVRYILSAEFDAGGEVVLNDPPPLVLDGAGEGEVEWLERGLNRHRLSVRPLAPSILIVADNWFPGWKAYVDDEEVELLRANHALRAVPVPAGEHTVEFRYQAGPVRTGAMISLLAVLGLLGTVGFHLPGIARRRRGTADD